MKANVGRISTRDPAPARRAGRRSRRTLPLRLWLVLAVAAIIGAGFLAQMGLTAIMAVWNQQAEAARITSLRQIVGSDPAAWRSPAWQRGAEPVIATLGAEVALYAPPQAQGQLIAGSPVYASAGARVFLAASGGTAIQQPLGVQSNQGSAGVGGIITPGPVFERLVITGHLAIGVQGGHRGTAENAADATSAAV